MNNSIRWKEFIKWWKELDDTEYGDQYALIKAVSEKIEELKKETNNYVRPVRNYR